MRFNSSVAPTQLRALPKDPSLCVALFEIDTNTYQTNSQQVCRFSKIANTRKSRAMGKNWMSYRIFLTEQHNTRAVSHFVEHTGRVCEKRPPNASKQGTLFTATFRQKSLSEGHDSNQQQMQNLRKQNAQKDEKDEPVSLTCGQGKSLQFYRIISHPARPLFCSLSLLSLVLKKNKSVLISILFLIVSSKMFYFLFKLKTAGSKLRKNSNCVWIKCSGAGMS